MRKWDCRPFYDIPRLFPTTVQLMWAEPATGGHGSGKANPCFPSNHGTVFNEYPSNFLTKALNLECNGMTARTS